MPIASIIMCGYNCENYLSRSLGSILKQTYPEIEVVFMDDGSKDNSYEAAIDFIPAFKEKGYTLKVYHQENQGPGYAGINAIKYTTGDFISFLDSDDSLFPESIQKRIEALLDNSTVNLVRTNGYKVYEGENKTQELIVKDYKEKEPENIFDNIVIGHANNFAGSYMIRKSALLNFYKNNPIPFSDYGQNLQIILAGAYNSNQVFIDEPLMNYYIYPNTHSHKKSLEEKIRMYEGWFNLRKKIVIENTKGKETILKRSRIHSIRSILSCILSEKPNNIELFNSYYKELQALKGVNLEYRMYNAIIHNSPLSYIFRTLYYLKRIID